MATLEKIKKLLAEQLNIDVAKISTESKVIEDLGADSLDVVEMLMNLEEEYNISVSEEEAANLRTVGDIIKVIDEK